MVRVQQNGGGAVGRLAGGEDSGPAGLAVRARSTGDPTDAPGLFEKGEDLLGTGLDLALVKAPKGNGGDADEGFEVSDSGSEPLVDTGTELIDGNHAPSLSRAAWPRIGG